MLAIIIIVSSEFNVCTFVVLVLTLGEVALRQSVGNVGKFAAIVAVLQWADVHVPPLLQLLQPTTLLLAFTVRI